MPYPEAIFDIDYFTYNPKPFFTLAKELYPGKYKPNYIHYFVRLLHEKGLLLRCYTQNIDGLERSKLLLGGETTALLCFCIVTQQFNLLPFLKLILTAVSLYSGTGSNERQHCVSSESELMQG